MVLLSLRIANNEAAERRRHWSPLIARLRANPFAAGQSRPVDDQHKDEEGRCCDRRGEGNLIVHVVDPNWMAPVNACGVTEFHVASSRIACGLILAKNASSSPDDFSIRGNT